VKRLSLILLFCLFQTVLFSQSLINLREKSIALSQDTIVLDSLSIVTESFQIKDCSGNLISARDYKLNFEKSCLIFINRPKCDSAMVSYKVFPINFYSDYYLFDKDNFLEGSKENPDEYEFVFSSEDYKSSYNSTSLSRKGSISRGIGFGNNQDVIVNSGMNLQLDGKLNEDLFIQAAISDNNIPIQPDGNSQQLQEFDKVFIKIYNDRISLTAGDFELRKPQGYFLNYNKKAQGADIGLHTDFKTVSGKEFGLDTRISGAVAKGKLRRQEIKGSEGNQGPYKLTGENNEQYIVVLAGTERVYIDGILLTRGSDNDYVIDYNLGEISFTPSQPINKDKRIVVEFEYSDRNYTRFLITGSADLKFENSKFWLNLYDESDNKNQPFDQDLDQDDKLLLSLIGDNTDLALVPGFDSLGFAGEEIRYMLTDTVIGATVYDSIFIYSTDPDFALYRVSFAFAGANKGNYRKGVSAANGRVYEWVAPVDGVPQGDYVPYRLIITPKKSQLINTGAEIYVSDKTTINYEFAYSKNDINTFSKLDGDDDSGFAFKTGVKQAFVKTDKLWFGAFADYEFMQKDFRAIENFKSTEFTRDWNISSLYSGSNENYVSGGLSFNDKKHGRALLNTSWLDRGELYSGLQNLVKTDLSYGRWSLAGMASYLTSTDILSESGFLRHNLQVSGNFGLLRLGIGESAEDNRRRSAATDSLTANSFRFNSYNAFVQTSDSLKIPVKLNYKYREDYLPKSNSLQMSTNSHDISFSGGYDKNPAQKFNTTLSYRILEVNDSTLYSSHAENNMTGRAEYSFRLWKGLVSSSNFYEIGSGLERKTEFSYIEVAPGQGVFTWTDYNSNGIQELDEFEVANFIDQANFIRIINPTAEYIKTYSNQINQSVNINPEQRWRNKTGVLKFLSRFSNQAAYMIAQKNTSADFSEYANPFARNIDDASLVSMSSSFRNSFSFNRGNPKAGADYIFNAANNKLMLVSGFDTRKTFSHTIQFRYNFSPAIGIVNKSALTDKYYNSEFFSSKNFEIEMFQNEFQLNFQPNLNNRLSIKYNYKQKENVGGERLLVNDAGLEYRLSSVKKGSLNATFNYIHYSYNSATNGALAYEMLEGLMPGVNLTWSVSLQRQLSNGLQLNLNYNARKSPDVKVIHTGGVQLRAFF
jgi:hypothetical protein